MSLTADEITIAITVYNRRQFVKQAISSALDQTVPVRVIVVEDCGPDPDLEAFIKREFGSRISYFRNPIRRGLFDNWNACLELCGSKWISILHDDDALEPCFVKEILTLSQNIPNRLFYFGAYHIVDANGNITFLQENPSVAVVEEVGADQLAWTNPIMFPGQLFNVASARQLGGFRKTSQYCGDWEMWFNLALLGGAARTSRILARARDHQTVGRGTGIVDLKGKRHSLIYAQIKRNLSRLRKQSDQAFEFNRHYAASKTPFTTNCLLATAECFSDRMLKYNADLLSVTPSRSTVQFFLKTGVYLFGPRFLKHVSNRWRMMNSVNR